MQARTFRRDSNVPARRRFLARLGLGSAAIGALVGSAAPAAAQGRSPRHHAVDDWMDALPSAHRMLFDAITPPGVKTIRHYASNVFDANKSGYDVDSRDLGVIVILRHNATPLAFNDAIWRKYGAALASELELKEKAPAVNPGNAGGESLDSLSDLGAHFGVCAMATRRYAGILAPASGGTVDAMFEELARNLIRNAHLTPAGIIAVGRAQERGFMFGYAG
jgi:hypothetical protein